MKNLKRTLSGILILILLFALSACGSKNTDASAADETKNAVAGETEESSVTARVTIKVGVVGDQSAIWNPIIETLAKEGIAIELVTFSDYTMPNQALQDGEIDLNAFQHYAYLESDIANKGFDLTVIGETIIAPLGIYSNKITDISELKEGDSIAIPNDVTNGGRALKVLETLEIITVDPDAGYTPSVNDITENPLNIEFYQVEAANTAALLDDVTAAFINGGHAVDNGFTPNQDAIYLEEANTGSDNPYINIIVARTEDKDNADYLRVVEAYRSDEVAEAIETEYKGSFLPTWE